MINIYLINTQVERQTRCRILFYKEQSWPRLPLGTTYRKRSLLVKYAVLYNWLTHGYQWLKGGSRWLCTQFMYEKVKM